MRTLDINKRHGLMLVANDDLSEIRYQPLQEGAVAEADLAFVYLKQAHYCARVVAQGLVIAYVHPLQSGWQRFDEAARWWTR